MNLRILKKLSKRAAPLLTQLAQDQRWDLEHFASKRDDEGYTSTVGHDRKHWDRSPSIHDEPWPGEIVVQRRPPTGRYPFVRLREPHHAWAGTPMVGWTSGYECPEWEERTAWEELANIVWDDVAEYLPDPDDEDGLGMLWVSELRLSNPSVILRHAASMAGRVVRA